MKTKTAKQTTVILAITLAFFLGRESKGGNTYLYYPETFSDTIKQKQTPLLEIENDVSSYNNKLLRLQENNTDTVYRCGLSEIYHPTLEHGSFKICRSKVTKLTIEEAKSKGMRHCRCSGNVLK